MIARDGGVRSANLFVMKFLKQARTREAGAERNASWQSDYRRREVKGLLCIGTFGCILATGLVHSEAIRSATQGDVPEVHYHDRMQAGGSNASAETVIKRERIAMVGNRMEVGFSRPAPGTTPVFAFAGNVTDREKAVDCLALAAWYEAGNGADDQNSVMQVVLNRLRHPGFPKSVCGVVFQDSTRSTGCQFTFTCDGSMQRRSPSRHAWKLARHRAEAMLAGGQNDAVFQATHYHADYVKPWWSAELERLTKIGAHIFYRWPGKRGALSDKPKLVRETVNTRLNPLMIDPAARSDAVPGNRQAPIPPSAHSPPPDGSSAEAAHEGLRDTGLAGSAQLLVVDSSQPSGRWAMAALSKCAGKSDCQVLAYPSSHDVDRNLWREASDRDRPIFLFVRDAMSGMAIALWDCTKVSRPDPGECLPEERPVLNKLMRNRSV